MKVVCETLIFITYREPCAILYRFNMNDIEKMTPGPTQAIAEIERKAREIIGLSGSQLIHDYSQSDATNTWI